MKRGEACRESKLDSCRTYLKHSLKTHPSVKMAAERAKGKPKVTDLPGSGTGKRKARLIHDLPADHNAGSVNGIITLNYSSSLLCSPYANYCAGTTPGLTSRKRLPAARTLRGQNEPLRHELATIHTFPGLISGREWGPDIGRTRFAPARRAANCTALHELLCLHLEKKKRETQSN